MRWLSLYDVLDIHEEVIRRTGGRPGVLALDIVESAVQGPLQSVAQRQLYPSIVEKACALAYAIVVNHPFVDGNKRVAHAAMEIVLVMNGMEIEATVELQEDLFLGLAQGSVTREELTSTVRDWVRPLSPRV